MKAPIALAAIALGLVLAPAAGASGEAAPEQCLMCHGGSFEALRERTKDWRDEFGDAVQPHQYVDDRSDNPHAGAKTFMACTGCHEAHAIPPKPDEKPRKATFSSCYGCHHMENFQKCSDAGCHEK